MGNSTSNVKFFQSVSFCCFDRLVGFRDKGFLLNKASIIWTTGQDGSCLAELLLVDTSCETQSLNCHAFALNTARIDHHCQVPDFDAPGLLLDHKELSGLAPRKLWLVGKIQTMRRREKSSGRHRVRVAAKDFRARLGGIN